MFSKRTFVTVGSHSGMICTVELKAEDNSVVYKIQLPNRIESSVVVLDNFKGIVGKCSFILFYFFNHIHYD